MDARTILLVLISGFSWVACPIAARAEPITWGFSGEVTIVNDPGGFFGGAIGVGDPFEGTYTFEPTTPDSWLESDRRGVYRDAITSITGHAGSVSFAGDGTPTSSIAVNDSFLTPEIDSYEMSAFVDVLGEPMGFFLSLYENDGSFLFSDELLTVPPVLDNLTAMNAGFSREGGPGIQAQLTDVWLVPEPESIITVVIGATVIIRRRSRMIRLKF